MFYSLVGKLLLLWTSLYLIDFTTALSSIAQEEDLTCDGEEFRSEEIVKKIGTCADGYRTLVEITNKQGEAPITICHDEIGDMTLWSRHNIIGSYLPGDGEDPTDDFRIRCFYKSINVKESYTQLQQQITLQELTGTDGYFSLPSIYLARGHLAPNADFYSKSTRAATYHFINASPEWQLINQGNRLQVENRVRALSQRGQTRNFIVWTGAIDILTLRNVYTGNQVPIYLGRAKDGGGVVNKLPVNYFLWKIIYEEDILRGRTGIAMIHVNNPYETCATLRNIGCTDVCDQTNWASWYGMRDFSRGYTYCCTVEEFRQWIPYINDYPRDFPEIATGRIGLLQDLADGVFNTTFESL